MTEPNVLTELIAMSRALGDPALDYAILGEGNTSARADAETFWVKASGAELRTLEPEGVVRVNFDRVLALLDAGEPTDADIRATLEAARADPEAHARPSVETVLHALALRVPGVNFIGHTHPTAVNAILCSQKVEEALTGRILPDEIVHCGLAPIYVPYTDPGVPLARRVRAAIEAHLDRHTQRPRLILMQNHGLIALGSTAAEVLKITAMYVKTARVLLGTYALGGPHFLTPREAQRIATRPDKRDSSAVPHADV